MPTNGSQLSNSRTEMFILVNGKTEQEMGEVNNSGRMAHSTRDTGRAIWLMVSEE